MQKIKKGRDRMLLLKPFAKKGVWPSYALAIFAWAIHLSSVIAYLNQQIPWYLASVFCTLANYLIFTPFHEAIHGNLRKGRLDIWTKIFGYFCGLLFFAPFRLVKSVHLTHHSYTNDPDRDPDMWVSGRHPLSIAFRCLTIYFRYFYCFLFKLGRPLSERLTDTILAIIYWAIAIGLCYEQPMTLISIFIIPVFFGTAIQAFVLDWIPHHPHETTDPLLHTHNYPQRILDILMVCHNWHLVHHIHPNIPFFHYREAWQAANQEDNKVLDQVS